MNLRDTVETGRAWWKGALAIFNQGHGAVCLPETDESEMLVDRRGMQLDDCGVSRLDCPSPSHDFIQMVQRQRREVEAMWGTHPDDINPCTLSYTKCMRHELHALCSAIDALLARCVHHTPHGSGGTGDTLDPRGRPVRLPPWHFRPNSPNVRKEDGRSRSEAVRSKLQTSAGAKPLSSSTEVTVRGAGSPTCPAGMTALGAAQNMHAAQRRLLATRALREQARLARNAEAGKWCMAVAGQLTMLCTRLEHKVDECRYRVLAKNALVAAVRADLVCDINQATSRRSAEQPEGSTPTTTARSGSPLRTSVDADSLTLGSPWLRGGDTSVCTLDDTIFCSPSWSRRRRVKEAQRITQEELIAVEGIQDSIADSCTLMIHPRASGFGHRAYFEQAIKGSEGPRHVEPAAPVSATDPQFAARPSVGAGDSPSASPRRRRKRLTSPATFPSAQSVKIVNV